MLCEPKRLETPSGEVETPILFPVRNIGKKNKDNTPKYESIVELNTAMVNSIAIRKRESVSSQLPQKNIHELIDFEGVIFADSGGFNLKDREDHPSPFQILEIQEKMKADIYATLDLPILPDMRPEKRLNRIEKNIDFALKTSRAKKSKALLYASVHGHDPKVIQNSISYLEKRGDFDGYALGGLVPIRNNYPKLFSLILAARKSTDKPLHVFGLGGMLHQLLLMYLGVDTFDSSSYIRGGSHREYYVPGLRSYRMKEFVHLDYLPCSCPICTSNSPKEVKNSRDLITKHNLWTIIIEMRKFKWIVEMEKDVESYLETRFEGHKKAKRAFKTAKQKVRRLT